MNKKGFTLIELLAVIVVLAVVATIAIPTILDVVEKAKKGSAESSTYGYINAIEMQIATDKIKGIDHEDKEDYTYDEIAVKVKGKKPTGGLYALQKGKVTEAAFCIYGYYVSYDGNKARATEKCNGDDLKLESTLTLSKSVVNLAYPEEEIIDVLENTSEGTLSCETSDSSVATCEILENKVKIKSGKKEDSATITVISEGSSRYKEARYAVLVTTEEGLLSVTANGFMESYDGNPHGITVTSAGATIKYGTEDGAYNLDNSPQYIDAGTYTVYYQVTKEGYKTVIGNQNVIIRKAIGSMIAPTDKELTYNGSAQELVVAGTSNTGTVQYKIDDGSYSADLPTATNAGTYTVYYKVVGDSNHYDVEERNLSVTINKAQARFITEPTSRSIPYYTGETQTLINAGTSSGGTIQYRQATESSFSTSVPTGKNMGTYVIYYKLVGDSNYYDGPLPSSLTVKIPNECEPKIAIRQGSFYYYAQYSFSKFSYSCIKGACYVHDLGNNTDSEVQAGYCSSLPSSY